LVFGDMHVSVGVRAEVNCGLVTEAAQPYVVISPRVHSAHPPVVRTQPLAGNDLFDLGDVLPGLARRLRRLAGKVVGAFAVRERVIYLDQTQRPAQRRFTHGHELGHCGLLWHDDAYYCDDPGDLGPDTHAELKVEVNAFSAELLFNLDAFTDRAHATRLGLAPALQLADDFDTSRHAAIRRYVETSPRPCALLILGKFLIHPGARRSLKVLRGLESARGMRKPRHAQ
jgi:hypothetical protein